MSSGAHTPNTPNTPVQLQPISQDWVNVECEDCSGLDKIPRHPQPALPPKKRTSSNPLLDMSGSSYHRNPRQVVAVVKEILTESCRSVSDPDLTSSMDKGERCSTSSGEVELEVGGAVVRDSSSSSMPRQRLRGSEKGKPPYNVRYSDNSLERSEVKKILDGIESMSESMEQPLDNGGILGSGAKWKSVLPTSKSKKNHKHHKDIQKIKKTSKIFHSSDDVMDQLQGSGQHGQHGGGDKEGRRSSSGSPQEIHSPVPKKKNGTGIFKLSKKKKHSIPLRPTPSPLDDNPFSGADSPGVGGNSSENGHSLVFVNDMPGVYPLEGDEVSPKHHTVSLPVHQVEADRQQEVDANFNLQTLIQPVNKNWVKCGYLWLRMKLPNGRYAWTHIVSHTIL